MADGFPQGGSGTAIATIVNQSSGRVLSAGGETSYDRIFLRQFEYPIQGSQHLDGVGMVALVSETIGHIVMITGATAAAATPTICQMAVYIVNPDASISLIANTANDTTLFAATFTAYNRAFVASWQKIAGQTYIVIPYIVTAVTVPSFESASDVGTLGAAATETFRLPYRALHAPGPYAALPANVLVGNLDRFGHRFYAALLP